MKEKSNICLFQEYDADEIIPNLWLGNYQSAFSSEFLKNHNIKNIIRIMVEFDKNNIFKGVKYYHIPIKDTDTCVPNIENIFNTCNKIIDNCLNNNEGILIHCKRGHHRSAAVVASYLIKNLKYDYEKTFKYINSLRPCALRRNCCIVRGLYKYCNNEYCNSNNKYISNYCPTCSSSNLRY